MTHPKFGRGFVSEIVSDSKVEVTFKDARRVLVHNRKNMPGLPLAAEGDGVGLATPEGSGQKLKEGRPRRPRPRPRSRSKADAGAGGEGPEADGEAGAVRCTWLPGSARRRSRSGPPRSRSGKKAGAASLAATRPPRGKTSP